MRPIWYVGYIKITVEDVQEGLLQKERNHADSIQALQAQDQQFKEAEMLHASQLAESTRHTSMQANQIKVRVTCSAFV